MKQVKSNFKRNNARCFGRHLSPNAVDLSAIKQYFWLMKKPRNRPEQTVKRKAYDPEGQTNDLSKTMAIPVEALFEDLPAERETHLDINCPGSEPRRVKLDDNELTIGRDDDCGIPLPLKNVSRHHSKVVFNGQEFSIVDLESTNGTYVNNIRISKCILRNSDIIRIGEAKLLFVREKTRG